ncbi:MAG TPA: SAM-dependent methyltransferase [Candidatus Sulfotelmatobacter sp.]|nr:SAM-dependent methyltransferase [Candidatus Sulfotelmatobacter sp.]
MKMPADLIREEIFKCGAISFARFMEIALYCPESGYYERNQDNVGRAGDFITSVSTGRLFGELLAFQFSAWLQELAIGDWRLAIVEAGAHDGKLAADILDWLGKNRAGLFAKIEYIILEPSPVRRQWQREKLSGFTNVAWYENFEALKLKTPNSKLHGVLFGNELLDAFPIRRLGWDAKAKNWFEHGVTIAGEKFAWCKIPNPQSAIHNPQLKAVLPDGYVIESSPAAENWWRDAAGALSHGKLVAIDYGFTAEEQFSPARTNGTLRAYFRHQAADDVLANPGGQDLTAHVNFSAIQKTGEAAGLKTETYCTQPQFLTRILGEAVKENLFAQLDPKQIRQFQTLTHPDHLGHAFRVLVQSR